MSEDRRQKTEDRNKRGIYLLFFLLFTLHFSLFTHNAWAVHPSKLKFEQMKFNPPNTEMVLLNNGIILHILQDKELPVIEMVAVVRTGSIYEPEDKTGLADITGRVMRSGGTVNMSGEEINERLEFIAGSVEVGIGGDSGTASMSVMKKDMDTGLKIFADILMNPAFREDKLDMEKQKTIEAIRRQNDDPSNIARREFRKVVYGSHPYGRSPTIDTISRIKRDDMIQFHKKYFHPNNVIMGIAGDFDKEEMIKKIEEVFKDWKIEYIDFPHAAKIKENFEKSTNFAFKDTNQSVIRMGHLGIRQNNPDYYAVMVMDDILGGGSFTSRLMKEVRSDRGLAYSVWSVFAAGKLDLGIFAAGCETKSESTYEVITLIQNIIEGMMRSPVSDEELQIAKEAIINSFIFGFTSNMQVVNQRINIQYYNLPEDYLEKYRENISKVTKEDVMRVAKKYLHPDKLALVVVGDDKKFDKPLSVFGEIKNIKLE
ncbi:MAG: insulinase family protein [Nitrospinae bacterium]|nr:insulinase family protein [Nitrospinota bacterium]